MFPVFAAHAAPGAVLMFTSGPTAGEAIGEWEGEPLYHGKKCSSSVAKSTTRTLNTAR